MDETTKSAPITLLVHDGELVDLRELLRELGADCVERRGAVLPEDLHRSYQLAVATPHRLLELEFAQGESPVRIAVCDSDSRSLRSSLQRAGIQLMVRRPVHPMALRGLLLHSLYRGPERRRDTRVNIGAPVRFRAGWRQYPAILADVSVGGARLLTEQSVEPGRTIRLSIPADLAGGHGAYSLKAEVLSRTGGDAGASTLTARFTKVGSRQLAQLRATVKAHSAGPASFEGFEAPDLAAAPARVEPPVRAVPSPAKPCAAPAAPPGASAPDDERRAAPRHQIDRRVIALDEESARVLVGRDISLGGMRVSRSPLLAVGTNVRLAIHVGSENVPLVVTARVHRDDGERGMVLRFHELDPDATRRLNRMLDALPMMDPSVDDGSGGMIVSEILAEAR